MSDLQCAATLLLTDAGGSPALGASLVDRRLAAVYASAAPDAVRTAEDVAAVTGVGVSVSEDLREPGAESGGEVRARVARELGAIADLHRGETVLVVDDSQVLEPALAPLLRGGPGAGPGRTPYRPLTLELDGDGWRLVDRPGPGENDLSR